MLWYEARQAEDEETHSSSMDLQTNKLDISDFDTSIEKLAWSFTQQPLKQCIQTISSSQYKADLMMQQK